MMFLDGAALSAAKKEIAVRLRGLCDHCTEEEFDQLVSSIAQIELKYRTRDVLGLWFGSSRSTGDKASAG
jgi:hypothetical protein